MVLGNGGSTAFWDVATFGLIRDRAQFLPFGEFGSKFAKAAKTAPFLGTPTVHHVRAGQRARRSRRGRASTSTPPRTTRRRPASPSPPTRVAGADADALMLFDATSAAGGLPVDPTEFDVYYFAPQKCFASDGGLWFALMSPAAAGAHRPRSRRPAATSRRSSTCRPRSTTRRLDQTYNTPALATIFLMAEQVDWFNANGGLDWCAARTAGVRRRTSTTGPRPSRRTPRPYVADPALRSQVVGTIDFDDSIDAAAVAKVLRANGIVDTEPYRKLGRNQLRVAMFPSVDPDDVRRAHRAASTTSWPRWPEPRGWTRRSRATSDDACAGSTGAGRPGR